MNRNSSSMYDYTDFRLSLTLEKIIPSEGIYWIVFNKTRSGLTLFKEEINIFEMVIYFSFDSDINVALGIGQFMLASNQSDIDESSAPSTTMVICTS